MRRPKGTGSIIHRNDGRWQGAWTEDGSRRYLYAWTREEVEVRLAALIASHIPDVEKRALAKQAARRRPLSAGRRFAILERDGFRCRYCGARPAEGAVLTVDHIVPVAAGGTDDDDNLAAACDLCNAGKKDRVLTLSVLNSVSTEKELSTR